MRQKFLATLPNDQLGMVVQPLYAGDATQEIQLILQTLPSQPEGYAALLAAVDPAYWGVLQGGVAAVGQFDCSSGCSGENIPAELSAASAGVYMLNVSDPMPTDSTAALNLITTVYPALNGLAFAEVTNAESGMAYMATAYGIGEDANGQGTSVAKVVYAGGDAGQWANNCLCVGGSRSGAGHSILQYVPAVTSNTGQDVNSVPLVLFRITFFVTLPVIESLTQIKRSILVPRGVPSCQEECCSYSS